MWHNFYRGEKKNHDSGSTVAWGSVAPLPLWSQNHEHVVLMLRIQCQGGGILGDVGCEGDGQNRRRRGEAGEASATRRGVISGPREPVLGKKHVELFLGMYDS